MFINIEKIPLFIILLFLNIKNNPSISISLIQNLILFIFIFLYILSYLIFFSFRPSAFLNLNFSVGFMLIEEFADKTLLSSPSCSLFLLEYNERLSLSLSNISSLLSNIYLSKIFSKFSFLNKQFSILTLNLLYSLSKVFILYFFVISFK